MNNEQPYGEFFESSQKQEMRDNKPKKQLPRRLFNFNEVTIREGDESMDSSVLGQPSDLENYSTTSTDGKTFVFFKDLEDHLIRFIQEADVVIGCVAWVTSGPILKALSKKKGVSIIVQKEDFLRPDLPFHDDWKRRLRQLYNNLPYCLNSRDLPGLNSLYGRTIEPVRCVGDANMDKLPACPRSHHKFVLFCKAAEHCQCNECQEQLNFDKEYLNEEPRDDMMHIHPYAVWTGSFNFTKNAVMSFENAVVLYDPNIVHAYYREYGQIAFLSESLDWTKSWMSPNHYFIAPYT